MKITLNAEQQQNVLQAERELTGLLPAYDEAEKCGIDCQAMRAMNRQTLERINNVKKTYFPNGGMPQ